MFREGLIEAVKRLESARSKNQILAFGLIGGFAVAAWGVPRATADIDFAVVADEAKAALLAKSLGGVFRRGDPQDPLRGVIEAAVKVQKHSIRLQLIFLPLSLEKIIAEQIENIRLFDSNIPVVSWKALVLLKVYAGGNQDLLDAKEVLKVRNPSEKEKGELIALAKDVNLSAEIEQILSAI